MWHINSSSSARPLRPTNSSSGFVRKWQKISGSVAITGVVIAACLSRLNHRNQKNSLFHHRLRVLRKTPARCRFLFHANFFCCVSSERRSAPSGAASRWLIKPRLYQIHSSRPPPHRHVFNQKGELPWFIHPCYARPLPHAQIQYLSPGQGDSLTAKVSLKKKPKKKQTVTKK